MLSSGRHVAALKCEKSKHLMSKTTKTKTKTKKKQKQKKKTKTKTNIENGYRVLPVKASDAMALILTICLLIVQRNKNCIQSVYPAYCFFCFYFSFVLNMVSHSQKQLRGILNIHLKCRN